MGDFDSYGADPRRIEKAGDSFNGVKVDYASKYKSALNVVKANYETLKVPYYGLDNDDYVNGLGFCCKPATPTNASTATTSPTGKSTNSKADNAELQQYYYHPDHLGSSSYITNLDGEVVQHVEYVPFGEVFLEEKNAVWNTPFLFNGKELDKETGLNYFSARYQDPKLGIFISVDPLAEKLPHASPYAFCLNNPVNMVDPTGMIPIPLFDKFKQWGWRIDSGFGSRNTGIPGASTFHKGLDFNYAGGGSTDFGASILTTHDGIASVDDNPSGKEGRMVIVTSPDGKFRTRYLHLSNINVKDGQKVSESDIIGEMGGSANGSERGRQVHLHYEIQKLNSKTGKFESIDPTDGNGKNGKKVIDPQKWIDKKTDNPNIEFEFDWNFGGNSKIKINKIDIPRIEIEKKTN